MAAHEKENKIPAYEEEKSISGNRIKNSLAAKKKLK